MDARLPRRLSPSDRLSRRVLLADDLLDGPVAVKLAESPLPPAARELSREWQRLSWLSHPAFTKGRAFGFLDDGRAWMSMERAAGDVPVGPLPWEEIASLADAACEALAYLHGCGLAHRDLKPDHLRWDAATGRLVLLDLGSSVSLGAPGSRAGTPGYVAPEQLAGDAADGSADLYSLGAVLYELATGQPAFSGRTIQMIEAQRDGRFLDVSLLRPDTPADFARLIASLLSPCPADRPANAAACRSRVAASLGRPAGGVAGTPAPCGRERELEALLELAEMARVGPVAATLAGPAGSGRSALLERLRSRLQPEGLPVLSLSLAAVPERPWTDVVRGLAAVADMPAGSPAGATVDDVVAATSSAAHVTRARESACLPVVLLLDDGDRASASTRAGLANLAASLPPGVLLVVADGARGDLLAAVHASRVDLGPLAEGAVRRLAAAVLRDDPGEEVVARCLATSRQPADVIACLRVGAASGTCGASPAPGARHAAAAPASCEVATPEGLMKEGRIAAAVAAWQARLATPGLPDAARVSMLTGLGRALWALAEPAEALACAEAALAAASASGDARCESEAARVLGVIYGAFGSTRDGVGWQRRALGISAERDDVPRHGALMDLGQLLVREGLLDAATRALGEAMKEATARGDAAGAALARGRLGRSRVMAGELGEGLALLRQALTDVHASADALAEVEVRRLLGVACCATGQDDQGVEHLQRALELALACGFLQELPALHEGLARASLRTAVRLRTPSGAIVDRRSLELGRAHVDKGLDLALSTGRMADRAALQALAARGLLLASEPRGARDAADEAHQLALEAGDLLVASQARLVRAEALLELREFGVALAEARIACEALERSGDLEDAWRGHALLARIHGAWGMGGKHEIETQAASRVLRRLESSLPSPAERRAFLADVDRAAALAPPAVPDSAKARRGLAPELSGSRFAGRADTEDLVDALIVARHGADVLARRLGAARRAAADARARRDALLLAASLAGGGVPRTRVLTRLADLIARACGGGHVVFATSHAGRLRVRAASKSGGVGPSAEGQQAALMVARQVLDTGCGGLALGAVGRRRRDAAPAGDVHVALPLEQGGATFGALVVRPAAGRSLRRADVRLLRAVAPLVARALGPVAVPARHPAAV